MKKDIVLGIVAHVDAGKTTLSEAMLYISGSLKKLGRVDNKDAFLDTYDLEKERGITIFSKQAIFEKKSTRVTLLDTPGHVDFSAEMERTLQVLDYAILVISGADGVQGHTRTLWKLLQQYEIPTFIFVNKMDQAGTNKELLLKELKSKLNENIVDFSQNKSELIECIASCDEELIEKFFETGEITEQDITRLVAMRKGYPCFFGSALKIVGVEELLEAVCKYSLDKTYPEKFGAKVFKITRDEQNNRLTHLKITGGSLKIKDVIGEEKINQIRIYSGNKYVAVNEIKAGQICAVTGLNVSKAGMSIGDDRKSEIPILEPVLNYRIILPEGCNVNDMLIKLKQLEEEEPELNVIWNEELKEIHAKLMGEIQVEIMKRLIKERFGVEVSFGTGNIVYKETIANVVEGVGHFEPLRHYAEVHLLMEPAERGAGMIFDTTCSEDKLDKNWQRLIITHLYEKEHRGVLIGAGITDIKVTLVAGKAHLKHTEGGDFRQATYRALRQGLMEAEGVLLEPYYDFNLEIPADMVGRALADIDRMYGSFNTPEIEGEEAIITGICPVSTMRDYHMEVISYTRGTGKLSCTLRGYEECHNTKEVIENIGYNAETDIDNPTGSVFCSHGAGFYVRWDEVKEYMHIDLGSFREESVDKDSIVNAVKMATKRYDNSIKEEKELEEIFARTYGGIKDSHNLFHTNLSNEKLKNKKTSAKKIVTARSNKPYVYSPKQRIASYVIVDGYNIIFAWKELKELAYKNIDSARDKLIDILCNYQGARACNIVVVFDAYKVKGHSGEDTFYNNVRVIYTKENQTADVFIEQMAHQIGRKYDVTVATSDSLEQVTVLAQGCRVLSARELKTDIEYFENQVREQLKQSSGEKSYILEHAAENVEEYIESLKE